ncbi:hypothetical protein Tco_0249885, partial [Tanacetum coccineum]
AQTILASLKALNDIETSQLASLPELDLCETPLIVAEAILTSLLETHPLQICRSTLVHPPLHSSTLW